MEVTTDAVPFVTEKNNKAGNKDRKQMKLNTIKEMESSQKMENAFLKPSNTIRIETLEKPSNFDNKKPSSR